MDPIDSAADPIDSAAMPAHETVSLGNDVELGSPGRIVRELTAAASRLPTPPRIGRYIVGERLGAGGMGEVFAAHDPVLGRALAIKLVHGELDDAARAAGTRLLREAQTLARVNHPNVVQIYEVGTVGARVYLAMEIVAGATLRAWARTAHAPAAVIDVLAQAGRGLHAVHRVGLVHRDVKPDNVIVGAEADGAGVRVRVVDFGLSRPGGLGAETPASGPDRDASLLSPNAMISPEWVVQSRLTATGAMVGTPVYMAPEQLRHQVIDARCDQFAFCVMAWEALAGQRPFLSGSLAVLIESHRRGTPAPPTGSDVPPEVWLALQRGLEVDPSRRWPDMEALVDAIGGVLATDGRWRRRGVAIAVVGAAVLAVPWLAARADPDVCAALGPDGSAARARLDRAGEARGRSGADTVVDALAARTVALAEHRRASCLAGEAVADEARVGACLDRADARVDAITEALLADGATAAVMLAIDREPPVTACDAAASWSPPLPDDPVRADAVAQVRRAVDAAMTGVVLGDAGRISGSAVGLRALAEATGHTPLIAEVALFEGELASALGDPERAHARLLEAADLAEASRHDAVAADAWAAVLRVAIRERFDAEAAREHLRRADASAARIGRPTETLQLRRAQLAALEGDIAGARRQLEPLVAALPPGVGLTPQRWAVMDGAADIEEAAGNLDGAVALHLRARAARVAYAGESAPILATVDYNLGKLELRRDRAEAAFAALMRAHEVWTRSRGPDHPDHPDHPDRPDHPDHPDLALVHAALQQWEMQYGTLAAAREHAERVLAIRTASAQPGHPDLGLAHLGIGAVAVLQGAPAEAITAYRAALSITEQSFGAAHPETALIQLNLGEAMVEAGDGAVAVADIADAVAILEGAGGLDAGLMAFAHRVHASALRAAGSDGAALDALDRAEALGADVAEPPEAALRSLERVRLARRNPARVRWSEALAIARNAVAAVGGDSAMMLRRQLDALASDPPSASPAAGATPPAP